jgi:Fe-S cluster biosynthesis and repair protein YggX
MTRKIIFSIIVTLTISCNQETTFSTFSNRFENVETVEYDSVFFSNNFKIKDRKLELIKPEQRTFLNSDFINELHGDKFLYEAYYLNKSIVDENLVLTYYLNLNRNIPFDVFIQRVVICTYDSATGRLLDFEEIGTVEQHFGQTITRYSTWTGQEILINEQTITENLNTGEKSTEEQNCQVSIEHKGLMKKNCG